MDFAAAGLNEFEDCISSFNLTERQLRKLFVQNDPSSSGKLDVTIFIKSIRARYLETHVLAFLGQLFLCLDTSIHGKLTILQLMQALRAEAHPDVMCGRRTKGQIILGFVPYFDDVDNISRDEFIELNL